MTRKIETDLIAAMSTGKPYKVANTSFDPASGVVYLHGSAIAQLGNTLMGDKFNIQFSLAGWNTTTTRSRINALARHFGHPGVNQKAYVPMSGGQPVDVNEWF